MTQTLEHPAAAELAAAKRRFYREAAVAADYDVRRFGGAGGGYVNRRELAIVEQLLPDVMPVTVDVATGTGRVLPVLQRRSRIVAGIDTSLPMLMQAPEVQGVHMVQGDAFALPVRDGACDAVVALRLLFHFQDMAPLLLEMRRVTRLGGSLVCDTSSWSPRGRLPLDRAHWGERVTTVSSMAFRGLASETGWLVVDERRAFLVSPYLYRLLSLRAARALERLEPHLPRRLLTRVFWSLRAK